MALKYPLDKFVHYTHAPYLFQLKDLVSDLGNVVLRDLDADGTGDYWNMVPNEILSNNAWKNAGGYWNNHPLKNHYALFYLDWFDHLSAQMGLETPFSKPEDLLFDYPSLREKSSYVTCAAFDFLVVNSLPMSGQATRFSAPEMDLLINDLHNERYSIVTTARCGTNCICTASYGMTVTEIGKLSQLCKYILMVSTGPSWPTFNIWNKDSIAKRVIIIDSETIGLSKNTEQVRTVEEARKSLVNAGIL
jgi:hypothetical protein